MKPKKLPINACLVPVEGPRREDCARYEDAFANHVRAHAKGNDAPCSCPENCRFWIQKERAA